MSAAHIRELNDAFRRNLIGGKVLLTASVSAWSIERQAEILGLVRRYDDFAEADDPYQEHDFGAFAYEGIKHFWKIDYYATDGLHGAADPSDPGSTLRVLTIMQADEY